MKTTIITVSYPARAFFLRACVSSFRANTEESLDWLVITERQNVGRMRDALVEGNVLAMEDLPGWRPTDVGYARQMQAKTLSYGAVDSDLLLFVDDDVIAEGKFSTGLFHEQGKPVIYYTRTPGSWTPGNMALYGSIATKNYVLALPFAYSRRALEELANTSAGRRILKSYGEGRVLYSEFAAMGEHARRTNAARLRNIDKEPTHWTVNQKIFSDYQRNLEELYRRLTPGVGSSED